MTTTGPTGAYGSIRHFSGNQQRTRMDTNRITNAAWPRKSAAPQTASFRTPVKTKLSQRRIKARKSSACGLCKPWKQGWSDKKTARDIRHSQCASRPRRRALPWTRWGLAPSPSPCAKGRALWTSYLRPQAAHSRCQSSRRHSPCWCQGQRRHSACCWRSLPHPTPQCSPPAIPQGGCASHPRNLPRGEESRVQKPVKKP